MAESLDGIVRRQRSSELDHARATFRDFENRNVESISDVNDAAGFEFPARVHERLEAILGEWFEEKHFGFAAGFARPEQTRTHNACRVERDGIARRDQPTDVGETSMLDRATGSVHHHEPTLIALLDRCLRDTIGGKHKVVIRSAFASGPGGRNHAP